MSRIVTQAALTAMIFAGLVSAQSTAAPSTEHASAPADGQRDDKGLKKRTPKDKKPEPEFIGPRGEQEPK